MKKILLSSVGSALLLAHPALAVMKPNNLLATSIEQLAVSGKRPELCVMPKHIPDGKYAKKDDKAEAELCSLNLDADIVACPKTNSTNPGVNFNKPPKGMSRADFLAKNCEVDDAKKVAKFKLSTSCSYTPSIVGYYHVSRALGNIVRVPPVVLRTMDLDRHKAVAKHAFKIIGNNPDKLIYQTWSGIKSILDKGASHPKADLIFVEGYEQSYGALQKNPKKEEFYDEFFNKGADRIDAFKKQNKIYQALINPAYAVSREYNSSNVQAMVQLRDAADFILLDTIMGQQDRMGNIHYQKVFIYPEMKDGEYHLETESDFEEVPAELQKQAVQVKALILKDNDCGVAKENRIKAAKLLDQVAHMNPSTYKRLLKLERSLADSQTKELFTRGMLFTESDYKTVSNNIREAAAMLKARCQSGKLKLDLDLDAHFSGAKLEAAKCELKQ